MAGISSLQELQPICQKWRTATFPLTLSGILTGTPSTPGRVIDGSALPMREAAASAGFAAASRTKRRKRNK